MPSRRVSEPTLYSVKVRRGPDVAHYDLHFTEDGLRFEYLGEYWEGFRPRTGLGRRSDLLIYSLRKRRRRVTGETRLEDMLVPYSEIKSYQLRLERVRDPRSREEKLVTKLILETRSHGRIEVEAAGKVYEIAKILVKRFIKRALEGGKPGL